MLILEFHFQEILKMIIFSFIKFNKGYSNKSFNLIQHTPIYDKTLYDDETIKNLILKKDIKAINFLDDYTRKNSREKEFEEVEELHLKWA